MRKVVKKAGPGALDTVEETIEGTPEEIREYERILERERAPKQKKAPELIKGRGGEQDTPDQSDALRRLFEEMERNRKEDPHPTPWWPSGPIWITSCSQCHRNPCVCRYFWDPTRIYCGPGVAVKTVTVSSNGTKGHTPFTFDTTYGGPGMS